MCNKAFEAQSAAVAAKAAREMVSACLALLPLLQCLGTVIVSAVAEEDAYDLLRYIFRIQVRRKSLLQSAVLPGKLSDCSSRNPAESEMYAYHCGFLLLFEHALLKVYICVCACVW